MPEFVVILPAAGRSIRFGGARSKLLEDLAGRPVIAWTLAAFGQRDDVAQIVVATSDDAVAAACRSAVDASASQKLLIVPGGTCRADSVRLAALASDESIEWLAVHDAARPLVSQGLIDRVFRAALEHGAVAAAMAVDLTIKQASGPLPAQVRQTLPRHELWAMQTPQAMRRGDLIEAFEKCPLPLDQVTDDVQLLELAGKPVWLVEGEKRNLKITTITDLEIAGALVK
jgi:2-C-methyl-D-erythritol 4-phosphate cytidylyltransferase